MRKMISVISAFILLAFLLAGCGGISSDGFSWTHTNVKHYDVDGRTVTCILVTNSQGGASVDCDWANSR